MPGERAVAAAERSGPDGVDLRLLAPDEVDLVEALWRELLDHLDELGSVVPLVPHEVSWPRRRAAYDELLADGRSFALGAWRGRRLIGYAMVHVADPDPVWATGSTFAELSTLSVTRAERGAGVGTALLDQVERELASRDITEYVIGVDSVNDGARRFYERRGFRVGFHLLHGRVGVRPHTARAGDDREPVAASLDETPDTAMHGEP
ncbi:MAG TPA: GNAT family N-acetyltransferase [Thermoleophilia bacterium]|nr:GNAT family N-acetyltransferase [Thermoleophilia bacterium]